MPGVADPGRLVWITHVENGRAARVSYPDALDYRDHATSSPVLAAVDNVPVHIATADATERVGRPDRGRRLFLDPRPGAGGGDVLHGRGRPRPPQRRSSSRPVSGGAASAAIPAPSAGPCPINGRSFTILGVAPPGFAGLDLDAPPDVFLPLETWLSGTDRAA